MGAARHPRRTPRTMMSQSSMVTLRRPPNKRRRLLKRPSNFDLCAFLLEEIPAPAAPPPPQKRHFAIRPLRLLTVPSTPPKNTFPFYRSRVLLRSTKRDE